MPTQKRGYLIITLLLGVLMGALDISIVGPAIPPIASSFALGEGNLGWIFAIYVLFNLVFINPFTKLSDKYGRRTAYIAAVLLFGAGSIVCAQSNSYSMLLLGRAIQGIGSAGIFPVASAIIGDVIEPARRGRFLGLLGSMFGIAFIVGPILAGVMLKSLTWHYLFLINVPITAILLAAAAVFIPNIKAPAESEKRLDFMGIALLGSALALLTSGMSILNDYTVVGSIAIVAAVVAFALWYRTEKRRPYASFNVHLLANGQIRNALIIGFGAGIFQAAFVFFPKFLVGTFNVTAASAGFMLLPLVCGTALGSPISGRVLDRVGSKPVVAIALPLVSLGFAIQTLGATIPTFYVGSSLIGFGLAMLVGSSLRYIVLNETSKSDRASAQGILTIAISGGQIVGSALIGIATEGSNGSYRTAFLAIAILAAMLTLSALRLRPHSVEEDILAKLKTD